MRQSFQLGAGEETDGHAELPALLNETLGTAILALAHYSYVFKSATAGLQGLRNGIDAVDDVH